MFQFLARLNLMDYSLLVGIHDCDKVEEPNESFDCEEENGVEEDEDSTGSAGIGADGNMAGAVPTPPDSPSCPPDTPRFTGEIDQTLEMFAVKSNEGKPMQYIVDTQIFQFYP